MLTILDHIPAGLLTLEAEQLHTLLDGPTLIHLPGKNPQPLYVSCLLHGNEYSGWQAVRQLLLDYQGRDLPRSLSVFIGNVAAAAEGLRTLDGQPDFNRIWKGGENAEEKMAAGILADMRKREVFAAIDVHNNSGLNPHYACINNLDQRFLHMAGLFSRTVVYFIKPDSVSSLAFAGMCPSVTLECGKPGDIHGIQHAQKYIDAVLQLEQHPLDAMHEQDIDLFHTTATVKIPAHVSFGFAENETDIWFSEEIEHMNFRELHSGTLFGYVRAGQTACLQAWDESGRDVVEHYFSFDAQKITTRVPVMPSMLSLDTRIIQQDCLCYLMERYRMPGPA